MGVRGAVERRGAMGVRGLAGVFACLVVSVSALGIAAPAGAQSVEAARQEHLGLLNNYRASQGLQPLQVDPELTARAQEWAERIAAMGQLVHPTHAETAAGVTSEWLRLGENVGMGSTTAIAWDGLVTSPSHNRNLVDPGWTHVGIGIAYDATGAQWVSQRFMELGALPPAPAPEPEPAPVIVPEPAPVLPAPVAEPEPQPEVLGAVLVPAAANLAVIPPVRYGGPVLQATPAPSDGGSSLPVLLVVVGALLLLLALAALLLWQHRRGRAPAGTT